MALTDMLKDLIGKEVVVVALPERNVGTLAEVTDEWVRLTRKNRKGIERTTVIKIDMITSVSEI